MDSVRGTNLFHLYQSNVFTIIQPDTVTTAAMLDHEGKKNSTDTV